MIAGQLQDSYLCGKLAIAATPCTAVIRFVANPMDLANVAAFGL